MITYNNDGRFITLVCNSVCRLVPNGLLAFLSLKHCNASMSIVLSLHLLAVVLV